LLVKVYVSLHPSNKSILLKLWNEKEGLAFSKAEQSTSWLSAQHQLIKYILVSDFKNNISWFPSMLTEKRHSFFRKLGFVEVDDLTYEVFQVCLKSKIIQKRHCNAKKKNYLK